MIRVAYLAGSLFVDGRDDAMPAGSLQATLSGSIINITTLLGSTPLVATDFGQIADANGQGFADPASCLAYLQATFARTEHRVPTISGVAGEAIVVGMPVARSRSDGTLRLARADTYALAFLAGLASTNTAVGFALEAVRSSLTLPDWTAIVAAPLLAQGQRYFLAPAGGLTPTPVLAPVGAGLCVAAVGVAASPTTLVFQPSDPILL